MKTQNLTKKKWLLLLLTTLILMTLFVLFILFSPVLKPTAQPTTDQSAQIAPTLTPPAKNTPKNTPLKPQVPTLKNQAPTQPMTPKTSTPESIKKTLTHTPKTSALSKLPQASQLNLALPNTNLATPISGKAQPFNARPIVSPSNNALILPSSNKEGTSPFVGYNGKTKNGYNVSIGAKINGVKISSDVETKGTQPEAITGIKITVPISP